MSASKKKILLMGTQGVGKTSMRAIIFANYIANDTQRLGATQQIENHQVRFLGSLTLSLWDCGWQKQFVQSYLTTLREQVYSNTEALVYVFDVATKELDQEMDEYAKVVAALREFSPSAKIFCLVHKMDLIPDENRSLVFGQRVSLIQEMSTGFKVQAFASSIWDETLYRAWSSIVYSMIPNAEELESQLDKFASVSEATEVILFERATFLVIAHTGASKARQQLTDPALQGKTAAQQKHMNYEQDPHRFEKISNIVKQFKLSCAKAQGSFKSLELRHKLFSAYIEEFTANTYVLVVVNDPTIYPTLTLSNIRQARKYFEPLVSSS